MCLDKKPQAQTLREVTISFNQTYPPAFIGIPKKEQDIKLALDALIREGYARSEVRTFTNKVIESTKFYTSTPKGTQYLSGTH